MHTSDLLTGRRLCVWVKIETVFRNRHSTPSPTATHTQTGTSTCACDRASPAPLITCGARWGTHLSADMEAKMFLFLAIFDIENCISRSFSATRHHTGVLSTCRDTTQRTLSIHLCSIVSSPSISDLDEKSKNRLISLLHGETRLNSCVCEVHEGRYFTDSNSVQRACCVRSIERARDP